MREDLKRRLDKIALVTPAMDPQAAQPDPQMALAQQALGGQPPQAAAQPPGMPPGPGAAPLPADPAAGGMAPIGQPQGQPQPGTVDPATGQPAPQQPPPPPGAISCAVVDPNSPQGMICRARMQAQQASPAKMAALRGAMADFVGPAAGPASPAFTTRGGRPAVVRRTGRTVFEQHADDGSVRKALADPSTKSAATQVPVTAGQLTQPGIPSQLTAGPSLVARALAANPVLASRKPQARPATAPGRGLGAPRTLPRLPGLPGGLGAPALPSGPPSGPGIARWVKTATPEQDARLREALEHFSITPDRLRSMRDELEGMDQFAGGYQDQRQADDAMAATAARFAGTGLGGLVGTASSGVMGAMAGAPAGALVGLGRGDVVEGTGRGLVRGGLTGLGMGAGGFLGRLAGGAMGHPDLGGLAGTLGGGTVGWLGSGRLLGEPHGGHDREKAGAADDPAALPTAPEAGDVAQPPQPGGDPGAGGGDPGKPPKPPSPDQLHLRDATSAAVACGACANFTGQACRLLQVPVAATNLCDAFAPGPQLAGLDTAAIVQVGGAQVPAPKTAGLVPSPLRGEGYEKSAAGFSLGGLGRGLGAAGRWAVQGAKDFGHRRAVLGHGLDHPYTQADIHATGMPRPPVKSLFSPLVGQGRMQRFYDRFGTDMQVRNTPEMRARHLYGDTPAAQDMVRVKQQAELLRNQAGLRNEAGDAQGYADLMQQHQQALGRGNRMEARLGRNSGLLESPAGSHFGAPRTDYRLREGGALAIGLGATAAGGGFLYGRSGRPEPPNIPGSVSGRVSPPGPDPAATAAAASGTAPAAVADAVTGSMAGGPGTTPPPMGEATGQPGLLGRVGDYLRPVGEHLARNWKPYALGAGGVLGLAALSQAMAARRRRRRRQELLAAMAEEDGYPKYAAAAVAPAAARELPSPRELTALALLPVAAGGLAGGLTGPLIGALRAPKGKRLEGGLRGAMIGRTAGAGGALGAIGGGLGGDALAGRLPEGLRPYAGLAGAVGGGLAGLAGGGGLGRWVLGPPSWERQEHGDRHHESKPLAPKHLTKDATYPGCGRSRRVQGRQKAHAARRRLRKRAEAVAGLFAALEPAGGPRTSRTASANPSILAEKNACGCGCARCRATAARAKVRVKRALVEGPPRAPLRVVHGPTVRTNRGQYAWQGRRAKAVTDDPEYARFGVQAS